MCVCVCVCVRAVVLFKKYISQSLNGDCSFEVHSVLATASGDHLQNMFPWVQSTHLHWTGTCSQDTHTHTHTHTHTT